MSLWSSVTWDVARAGGLTAYVLLTLSVILGLLLSVRWQSTRWPRLITNDLHRYLTLLSLVFVAVHGLASLLDPFMQFSLSEILVPLMSHYRPVWMALGIVAGYLGVALWLSTELRPWIGYTTWRRLHGLTFAVYALATVHGLATGSDSRTPWALALYAGSVMVVGTLLGYRLLTPIGARGKAYPNLATLLALVIVGGALWTASGPARSGWNAIANNGQGNGARGLQAAAATSTSNRSTAGASSGVFAAPFSAGLQGTLQQTGPDAGGSVTLRLSTTLSGGPGGTFQMLLQGTSSGDGSLAVSAGQLTLIGPGGSPRYQGTLQGLSGDATGTRLSALLRGPGAQSLSVQGVVQLTPEGRVSGTIQATPV